MTKNNKIMRVYKKKVSLLIIFTLFFVCLAVYVIMIETNQSTVVTEDAYVEGNLVQVTSQVSGTIIEVSADNTDYIQNGKPVITINPLDSQLALEKAKSQLAVTVRKVRNQYATLEELKAAIDVQQTVLDKAQDDFLRRSTLQKSYAISMEELAHAREAKNNAYASLNVTIRQYQAALTLTKNTTLETHPDVLEAESTLREAWLDFHRTKIISPVSGFIAQRRVQVGQHVVAGSSLMTVVPLDSVWVTANFKETQLGELRVGHIVRLTSDTYGRSIIYHGNIIGIEPGTGSAFSLLPAQNATGNWIKVVQRVPVRVSLNREELIEHPLRPGLSMKVTVETDSKGEALSALPPNHQRWSTSVYENEDEQANAIIQEIMKKNG
ncbi:Inner membrane protein yiaV precursor [Serratia ficaria]|uniref:HlyD family efflux transporter periplasmic adaptor subunit n=1 Tax=Enterobacterales TaxID=91347 RepID=UPI000F7F3984|nr:MULTISPECIES: HlyD family efflux transporter periplasmic adaptor subunit [Enterobacterales]RSV87615.1 HlyD family efflux transporter periplasmic adaptor subunit [Klebsiella aerogenes]CAI1807830.1 Inner membrane protein yiaV precursor [Serratia ficaria]